MKPESGTRFEEHHAFGGKVARGSIAPYVVVPGSKARVVRFSELWDESHRVAEYREFLIYTGRYKGVPLTACSTGIGGTSVAVAVRELIALGAHTLIRVGVTGTLQDDVSVGDLTIASAAIRDDRVSGYFVPTDIPALSSTEVVLALASASLDRGCRFHVGVTATTGSFYCGEGRPGALGFTQSFMTTIVEDLARSGVLDWDTETSILFSLGTALGARVGRINGVVDSPSSSQKDPDAEEKAVLVSLDAISILAGWDSEADGHASVLRYLSATRIAQ